MMSHIIPYLDTDAEFPPPETASPRGIVAYGGSLSAKRLTAAYQQGIFPWYNIDEPPLWWSPDPRMVLFPERLHISRNARKLINKGVYAVTYNHCFTDVIKQCAMVKRKRQDGTWIHPQMIEAYNELHKTGIAQSVEVWQDKELVGGLYGIRLKHIFCGESMFSKRDKASQIALIFMLKEHSEIKLVDCQVYNDYLASLGAQEISRADFLSLLKRYK